MSANEMHVGDIGTAFKIYVKDGAAVVTLTGTTNKQITIKRPDKTILTDNINFYIDGSDGILTYIISTGTFNQEGTFQFQISYENNAGRWHSDLVPFDVYPNLA